MAIEDRSVSKGIERAQKKVEERNFEIRKNLLEYDEVMDHQRRDLLRRSASASSKGATWPRLIWDMIDESIAKAVDKYLDPGYPAECIAEWCRTALQVPIPAGRTSPKRSSRSWTRQIRKSALDAAREQIDMNLGEYMAEDTDPEEWDLRGLGSGPEPLGHPTLPEPAPQDGAERHSRRLAGSRRTEDQRRRPQPDQTLARPRGRETGPRRLGPGQVPDHHRGGGAGAAGSR